MAITTSRYAIVGGINLNTISGLSIYAITPPGSAKRTLNIFALARRHARKLSSAWYQSNAITLGVYITANSREQLEAAMDQLYQLIQGQETSLVVPRSGGTARQYTGTFDFPWVVNNNLQNTDSPSANYADLTLVFETSDSYGYDQFFTPMIGPISSTASPNQWSWTFGGSADTQVPIINIYFTGGSLGSGIVTLGNNGTGQQISVNRTWAIGDTLTLDCQNKKVQVNGVDVNFTGAIPEFGLGPQTIAYSDNFVSRTYKHYSYVYQRWG